MMNLLLTTTTTLLIFSKTSKAFTYRNQQHSLLLRSIVLHAASDTSAEPNPCWQDLYDDDCAMETIFTAQYVAGDWIKKLPCAQGMEVSLIFVYTNT
jgi:hypothetical protein